MRKIKTWHETRITSVQDIVNMIKTYKKYSNDMFFIDTETTGLHIINDIPFLLQVGFINKQETEGWVYLVSSQNLLLQTALTIRNLAKDICGHNIKFDIHMLLNLGVKLPDDIKYHDTQIYIRGAHDALTVSNGGPPLGLKEYAHRYIERGAKEYDKLIQSERTKLAKEYNVRLKNKMYAVDKHWTLANVDAFFKDVLNDIEALPNNVKDIYTTWLDSIPKNIRKNMSTGRVLSADIPYTDVNKELLLKYAKYDIIYTAEVYIQCRDSIKARKNEKFLETELALIPALIRMERCGFQMNKEYIKDTTKEMSKYLKQQRDKLTALIGEEIKVGQHALIKNILNEKYNLPVDSTGVEALGRIYDKLKHERPDADVTKFIGLVQELRTLEKWYSTYLLRFIREMEYSDRIYTQINQVGTVSGRVTSDFQQFPRGGIVKDDGSPLFNPRAMVVKSDNYKGLVYLDYSQVELRVQAMYTILVGYPDLNLCRAYMPYKCYTPSLNKLPVPFDYNNKKHLEHIHSRKWYHEEDGTAWHPVDVHAATTQVAFPDVEVDSDEFKKLRNQVGKRVNFAKNYGAQFNRIKQMFPEYDDETIQKIDEAYYKAFPGVKEYHRYCYDIAGRQTGINNLFSVKYYGLSGHKLINTLIQGSSAYFLKDRILVIDKYIRDNNLKTKMQMQIHDELAFELKEGEEHHIEEIRKIMQNWEGALVPIVAEMEYSTTTWADKKEVDNLE